MSYSLVKERNCSNCVWQTRLMRSPRITGRGSWQELLVVSEHEKLLGCDHFVEILNPIFSSDVCCGDLCVQVSHSTLDGNNAVAMRTRFAVLVARYGLGLVTVSPRGFVSRSACFPVKASMKGCAPHLITTRDSSFCSSGRAS